MNRRHAHRDEPWKEVSVREFVAEAFVFFMLCAALVALVFVAGDYQ